MANRKKITADLNGGDAVTAMADLVFQVHDASDDSIIATANYAEIGSVNTPGDDSANITYTLNATGGAGGNGQIILDGVDIDTATEVKIRCKDESGNESVLSATYVAQYFYLNATGLTDKVYGTLTGISDLTTAGDYIEIKYRVEDVTAQNVLFGDDSEANRYIVNYDTVQFLLKNNPPGTTTAWFLTKPTGVNDTWTVARFTVVDSTHIDLTVDGATTSNILHNNQFPYGTNRVLTRDIASVVATQWMTGDLEYIDFNGKVIQFKDTSSVHTSEPSGVTLTLASVEGTTISTLFTAL